MSVIKKENLLLGVLISLIGYFFSAMVGAMSKFVGAHISIGVILFFQNLICLLLNWPQIQSQGLKSLKTKRIGLHLLRDASGFASYLCLFAALLTTPLVNSMLLSYSEPLWIPLVAFLWLKVKMKGYIWWGILTGFLGVVLILQPSQEGFQSGALLALLSGVIASVMLIAIHRLSLTEPTHRTVFYNSLFGTIVTAPFFFYHLPLLSWGDLPALASVGFFTYLSQFLNTYSFKHGNPTTLGYYAYTVIVFSGILGWMFWGEIPNALSIFGMCLVMIGGIISIYFEKRYQKKIEKAVP